MINEMDSIAEVFINMIAHLEIEGYQSVKSSSFHIGIHQSVFG
jgi:hypothetical protein